MSVSDTVLHYCDALLCDEKHMAVLLCGGPAGRVGVPFVDALRKIGQYAHDFAPPIGSGGAPRRRVVVSESIVENVPLIRLLRRSGLHLVERELQGPVHFEIDATAGLCVLDAAVLSAKAKDARAMLNSLLEQAQRCALAD